MLYFQLRDPRRDEAPREFYFNSGFEIGDAPGNGVVLVDPDGGPVLAEVVVTDDTYWLEQDGSRVALRAGDRLALGPYELTITRVEGAAARGGPSAKALREAHARQARERANVRELWALLQTPFVARSEVEAGLLRALRRAPQDDATLVVYADYLEQSGHSDQALLARRALRGASEDAGDLRRRLLPHEATWRAVVTRPPIASCEAGETCPGRWDRLAPTAQDDVRHCGACDRDVRYCISVEQARQLGAQNARVAFDAALMPRRAWDGYCNGLAHRPAED